VRLLLLGLDCAAPEILLRDEGLENIRHLMAAGIYGRLESVVPAITVPAWLCMGSSQDPGSLGIYGFRNRRDRSYDSLYTVDSQTVRPVTMASEIGAEGGRILQVGVPPSMPLRRVNGISVGCFLTPTTDGVFTHPTEVSDRIRSWVGEYPVDVAGFRRRDRSTLAAEILELSRTQFSVFRRLLREEQWDFAQFVDIGLDRIQHGFWKHHDPAHPEHDPGSPYRDVIRDYYRHLDREIGEVLGLLDDDTAVLVASDHGAQALQGGICVNEWLRREGYLVLREEPAGPTDLHPEMVDWSRTRAWAYGGYYARVFLNVRGREPEGAVDPDAYESVRDELAERLRLIPDAAGLPMSSTAHRPEDVYRHVRGVAPDLLVYFDDMRWRAVGKVGTGTIHVRENDTGPDDCNHAPFGAFVLAVPGIQPAGEVEGTHLLDVAPTLLTIGGYEVPESMQGRSRVGELVVAGPPRSEDERTVRERLAGLGYLE
jgi:predicted AlkP superfamily phosphohydrolase/phosphomutase